MPVESRKHPGDPSSHCSKSRSNRKIHSFNIVQALPDFVSADLGYRALFAVGNQDNQELESGEIRTLDLGCPIVLTCNSVHFADTDPTMLNQFGERILMVDGDPRMPTTNQSSEPGTDASQLALLYVTGYSPDRIALVSPIGLPSPVPEPANWALMLMGLAAVGVAGRRSGETATCSSI